jgi:hypothetical protein
MPRESACDSLPVVPDMRILSNNDNNINNNGNDIPYEDAGGQLRRVSTKDIKSRSLQWPYRL